jgi:hypothetical protein
MTAATEKKTYTAAESKAHAIQQREKRKAALGLLTGELPARPGGINLAELQEQFRAKTQQ